MSAPQPVDEEPRHEEALPRPPPPVHRKFYIQELIGKGTFGLVHKCYVNLAADGDAKENFVPAVIKLEELTAPKPMLVYEYTLMTTFLQDMPGVVPRVYASGLYAAGTAAGGAEPKDTHRYVIMEQLGESLLARHHALCGGRPLGTPVDTAVVLRWGAGIIRCLRAVHQRGLLHRDVKPENFLFGLPGSPQQDQLHIIDFGLSRWWRHPSTGAHRPYGEGHVQLGTPLFMSVNAHLGTTQSRRDDMVAAAYMLVALCNVQLPWDTPEIRAMPTGPTKTGTIARLKSRTEPAALLAANATLVPACVGKVLASALELDYQQEPPYETYLDWLTASVV